ncbi:MULTISPECIES: hypothetical protein [Aeromonas]|uniref:hypothetical protein n=1 Tax=Aeromonas TaxID=642 RepID=UPI000CDBAD49|nr:MULTISPECIES: hypothetical protein [Aeromonas]AUY10659.1 hypothetical protein C3F36_14905 [Aeromonas sp. ASNIH2]AVP83244.1 hypothetical protein C7K70_03780 [Aeromonas hydrophila]ELA9379504.1 hypothetical protein [Aeromonas hydrophila]
MRFSLNWKQPLLSMSKRFFIFITLMFAGGAALSTYKTQLNMELGIWLFYQYLKILLAAFVVLFVMAQASRLFSVELRSEDVVGRNRFFRKVSIPYTEMVGVSMGKVLIVDCMVIRTNSLKRIYAPFELDDFQGLSDKIDAKLKHRNTSSSDF